MERNKNKPLCFTVAAAAKKLGIGRRTVYREIQEGRLPKRLLPNRTRGLVLFESDLDEWCSEYLRDQGCFTVVR